MSEGPIGSLLCSLWFDSWDRQHIQGVAEQMSSKHLQRVARTLPRGSPDPGGCTFEHLRVLMDDQDTMDLLFQAATGFGPGEPSFISIGSSHHSPIDSSLKAGCSRHCNLLHLPPFGAKNMAKQFAEDFEQECSPFQYAPSTRAGTDCVGHPLRAATDASPSATVLSVDGIGVCDHVLRGAMLGRLERMPRAKAIFPFWCGFRTLSLPHTAGSITKESGRCSPKQRRANREGSGRLWPVQFGPIHFWPSCLASQFWPIHFWPKLEVGG